jgi:hypothetical protein
MKKKSRSGLTVAIIAATVVLLLLALNPSTEDFQAWQSTRVERSVSSGGERGLVGALKSGAGKVAGAIAGAVAGGFKRKDYLLCSTYSLGSKGELYLGIAHLFIKLR